MRKCWICDEHCDRLSTEHIIPRHFGGIVTTTKFSCQECNQALGKSEEQLNRLSILGHYFDNAQGYPGTVTQLRGARSKETAWSYGDSPAIQVSTSGHMRSDGWKRPPGKNTTGAQLWLLIAIPSSLSVEHVHKSMVKAVMALAAHVGFRRDLFEAPLEYLAGNDQRLNVMQPTDLGIPAPEVFARVWVFAPPARVTTGVYGAVAYGPLSSIYRLCTIPVAIEPFCYELRAYSRGYQLHRRQEAYLDWRSVTLGEIAPPLYVRVRRAFWTPRGNTVPKKWSISGGSIPIGYDLDGFGPAHSSSSPWANPWLGYPVRQLAAIHCFGGRARPILSSCETTRRGPQTGLSGGS